MKSNICNLSGHSVYFLNVSASAFSSLVLYWELHIETQSQNTSEYKHVLHVRRKSKTVLQEHYQAGAVVYMLGYNGLVISWDASIVSSLLFRRILDLLLRSNLKKIPLCAIFIPQINNFLQTLQVMTVIANRLSILNMRRNPNVINLLNYWRINSCRFSLCGLQHFNLQCCINWSFKSRFILLCGIMDCCNVSSVESDKM